ncbi:MAG: O-antigen ligase family protein [Pseudomonadota bacterium]
MPGATIAARRPSLPRESLIPVLRSYWPALLVLSVPALLPFSRLVELPLLVMLVLGVRTLVLSGREVLQSEPVRLFALLFGCYWIPGAVSAIDALDPGKSASWTLAQLRFVPVGVFIATRIDDRQLRWVLIGTGLIAITWAADALFQAATGVNLAGMPRSEERLNGIFGPTNIKLGHMLAVLAPFALYVAARGGRSWRTGATWLLLAVAILLIGTRAAWIMFAVVTAGMLWLLGRDRPLRMLGQAAGLLALSVILALAAYGTSADFRDRADRSLQALSGDAGGLNEALTYRLPIWKAALSMAGDHPANGVGVRSFRTAYPDHAPPDDRWVSEGGSATHAHHVVLEVGAETGLVGLLGLVIALAAVLRTMWHAPRDSVLQLLALALLAMIFPLNTHLAFYSTFWSIVCWWFVALFCRATRSDLRFEAP